jgi:hypothetical protein
MFESDLYFGVSQWFRMLDAGLSNCRPRFNPRLISVGFMVDVAELQQVYVLVLRFFFPDSIDPSMLLIHSSLTNPVKSQELTASLNNTHSKF